MACGIGLDISEKKQLEKEVLEVQKMEALGTLAGGVAHDLNNVLGGIMGYTEIIKSHLEDGETPNMKHVDVVLDSCRRGAGIVQQILMFSRRTGEKKIPLQLYSVVRDAVKLITHTILKSIEVKQDMARDKTTILADPNQLHQVAMNICTNAWHAMRESGGVASPAV
ncbi:MAG: hypothetical protein JXX14_03470 [Deltaproteobacteria bacterium]|nr:hypothetical protein [Deltaproteobacteria bacterium]